MTVGRTQTLADGQLAASAATILAGSAVPEGAGVSVVCCNTGSGSETVTITFKRAGGTARRIARAVLAANETLVIAGLQVQADDTILGAATDASVVDYLVSGLSNGPLQVYTLDANAALKQVNSGIAGDQSITGDLSVLGGDIDAGASGAVGTVDVFPSTAAKGKMRLTAADSAGDTVTTLVNASQAGARTYTIPDLGASGNFVLASAFQSIVDGVAFNAAKWVDVTVTAAILDGAGAVNVIGGVVGDQYKVRGIRLVGGGTNFGAGGDRTIVLTDGTTTWTTIANADIETAPATTLDWGNAKVPYATGTSDTASASNAAIRFQYAGGTTDHGGVGSIKFSVQIEKVA